jgi:SAM-dependent methyltransferase
MSAEARNAYDEVLYPGHALAQAHPDRLATLATLSGMTAPGVESCRVLELGCGDGTNLISVAQGLPHARCLGMDLAEAGIVKGNRLIERLRLDNVVLRQLDIMDAGEELGTFDFIVAHGIYCWVPEPVRDRLLAVCRERLAPNGVAYVSYNTYPGCHIRQMVRGLMRFHVQHMDAPEDKVNQGRALLRFLAQFSAEDPGFYRPMLERELDRLTRALDSTVFHDDLSDTNAPVYFHEFVQHAARHGLQYLSEAQFFEMQSGLFPREAVELVNQISDSRVAKEQYLDFLKCRSFRQTLLVHADQQIDFEVKPERLAPLSIASPVRPVDGPIDVSTSAPVVFSGPKRSSLTTDNPLIKASLVHLGDAWPEAVAFSDLLAQARALVPAHATQADESDAEERAVAETLLKAYAGGLIELHSCPPRLAAVPGERPLASPLARVQAETGSQVTNLRHHNILVQDELGLALLRLLDGTRDRTALIGALSGIAEVQRTASGDGVQPVDADRVREVLGAQLEDNLMSLGRMALLAA